MSGFVSDDVRPLADLPASFRGRVAVVDRGAESLEPELRKRSGLILRERLRRVEVDRPDLRIAGDRVEDGKVEREGLPRGGAGRDDDVLAALCRFPRFGLVSEERRDAGRDEGRRDARIEVVREAARASAPVRARRPSTRSPRPRASRPSWSRVQSQVWSELALESRSRLRAVDGCLRLPAGEEDHSG